MQDSENPRKLEPMVLQAEEKDELAPPHDHTVSEDVRRDYEVAVREGSPLSVVVAGLDGFRMVYDCLGPIEGDTVLAAFAACLGRRVQQVSHLGGDQLVGLLASADAPTSMVLAEQLREEVAVSILTAMGKLTASFGVAAYPDSAPTAQELVYGAQAAMY